MAQDLAKLPYRPCVGIALFNAAGEVFVGRRVSMDGEASATDHPWQMPQGGIDAGEDPKLAAIRELQEETNITSVVFLREAPDWLAYDLPPHLLGKVWKGRFRGQTQKWFAFRFTGDDGEINISAPAGGHKPEFVEWRWLPLTDIASHVVPFKRKIYEDVARIFATVPFSG